MDLISIIVFVFGIAVGSFLNAVSFRFHTGYSLLDRSRCFSCGETLGWRDLVPLVSYIIQGGKCRYCRANISGQYFIVELLTAVLFFGIYLLVGVNLQAIIAAALWSVLVLVVVYDIRHGIIPNLFAALFTILALALWFVEGNTLTVEQITTANILAGPLFSFIFYGLWRISGGQWMGLGDAKLVFGIGILLGLAEGFSAIILAFWIGAAFALIHMGVQRLWERKHLLGGEKELTMKSRIPFAPYLILGTALVYFFDISVFLW